MAFRIKLVDTELSAPPVSIPDLAGYTCLRSLVRLHGTPIGSVDMPIMAGRVTATALRRTIVDRLSDAITHHLLVDRLAAAPSSDGWRLSAVLDGPHPTMHGPLPLISVAVCTRDRPTDLARCLDGLHHLEYPALDLLVVDNAPRSNASERLVRTTFPRVRYVQEPRPGLNWARNRAITEAHGDIIAFTDDDVVVDPTWARAIAASFAEPEVMAVTGLIVPYQLETDAEILFERYGGFGRGYTRRWWRLGDTGRDHHIAPHGAGQFGTGANMAFRRCLFDQIGSFDPALDVGTVTNGGGDLEMFFRVLKEGYLLAYEPGAVVRHCHRREYVQLRSQIANNGTGFYAYLARSALAYPDELLACVRFGLWWFWWWNLRRWCISFLLPSRFPRDLIFAELRGSLVGLNRYLQARRTAAMIQSPNVPSAPGQQSPPHLPGRRPQSNDVAETRVVDLAAPLRRLVEANQASRVNVRVMRGDRMLGDVSIVNHRHPIGAAQLREVIAAQLGLSLLEDLDPDGDGRGDARLHSALLEHFVPPEEDVAIPALRLPAEVPVSVVVATHDRPADLRTCLRSLVTQHSPRRVEMIVVDNHPASGLTPPVVAEFPGVMLVSESRQGLSYARNKGAAVSSGDIIVATDDDVVAPPEWLERLLAPFARADVMVVTGNTLPLELETKAQRLFERYGGLGRGSERIEADRAWFESYRFRAVPTWELGATANAAWRTDIFSHPAIGLLDEGLGAGMPTGCSEDTDLFYRVLKAGYTIVYEPTAFVWHRHRRDMRALRRQIYSYSKGHVAFQLTTLLRDHDLRALQQLLVHLPGWRLRQLAALFKPRPAGFERIPASLVLLEIAGNLAGPSALWRSRQRVKREGRSAPFVPRAQRTDNGASQSAATLERPTATSR